MRFHKSVPYRFAPVDVTAHADTPELVLIVKGTFGFEHRSMATPADEADQLDFAGDTPFMDEIGRSLRYSTDLAAFKPSGEITVTADCCVPGGREAREQTVFLEAGPIRKQLVVMGDRVWLPGEDGSFVVDGPVPFSRMPLRWERAFGGMAHPENPFGRGIDIVADADGKRRLYLPNIESPRQRVTHRDDQPAPAGFGPVPSTAASRLARLGTRDQRWVLFRAPLPPHDYDPAAEQAAPADQWLEGYWRGDEGLRLGGMDPAHEVIETALPQRRLRLFVEVARPGEGRRFSEVPLMLDTVHVAVTERKLVLVWRRTIRLARRDAADLEGIYVTEEPMASEPRSVADHHADFLALCGPDPEPPEVLAKRREAAAVAEARKTIEAAKLDPSVLQAFDAATTSQAKLDLVMDLIRTRTAELERLTSTLLPK